jgi:hypothetical protein
MSSTPFAWSDFEAEAADPANHIHFTPVPRRRARRNGWSPERQQLFLFALSRCGSVARAARAAGMTPRSAYQLLDSPAADSFAEAWDRAIEEGIERVRADALERALAGVFVPVFRRGKLVRVEHRRCDKLALALLSGHHRDVDYQRQTAVARRHYKAEMGKLPKSARAPRRSGPSIRRSSTGSKPARPGSLRRACRESAGSNFTPNVALA